MKGARRAGCRGGGASKGESPEPVPTRSAESVVKLKAGWPSGAGGGGGVEGRRRRVDIRLAGEALGVELVGFHKRAGAGRGG